MEKQVISISGGYSSAIGDTSVSCFKIKVVRGENHNWRIGVGVAIASVNLATYLSDACNNSIVYYSFGAIRYKSGSGTPTQFLTYTQGDVITVKINKQDKTVMFFKGEQLISTEVVEWPIEDLFPAVHMNTIGDVLEAV